jgi:superfamily I DNA and/or RNA helicase
MELIFLLQKVPTLSGMTSPYLWLDTSTTCYRDPVTHSLSNPEEAKISGLLAVDVANIVGPENVIVLTPYKAQVFAFDYEL